MRHIARPWKHLDRDLIRQLLLAELLLLLLNLLCYGDRLWLLPMQLLLYPYLTEWRKYRKRALTRKYALGFSNLLQSLMTSVQAGYTLENACRAALTELSRQYGDSSEPTLVQLRKIVYGMNLGIPVGELFMNYARETANEDILQFAAVLDIIRTTGGNMVQILKNTMLNFQRKLDTEEEIRVILSGMVYEKNIMLGMPLMIMTYMRLTNGDYMACLYNSLGGHILVTAVLMGILACYYWTESMIHVEI